ncbi:MAG: ribonuclease E/G, partial [Pseudomonadota bacterium]
TKEGSIEDTALKTNLEAAEEVARQARLRDLAGLIVIDFIDMEENRNNRAVEKRMKDRLKNDRARIQIGRISSFGLMEMSRQRLRPGLLEATTQACPACQGTGIVRSDDNMALSILREVEEEAVRGRAPEIAVNAPVEITNFLINQKREHIAGIEERCGVAITLMGDPSLTSPDFSIERLKTPSRKPAKPSPVVTAGSVITEADLIEDAETITDADEETAAEERPEREGKSRRRRGKRGGRRRRGGDTADARSEDQSEAGNSDTSEPAESEAAEEASPEAVEPAETPEPETVEAEAPKPKRARRSRKKAEPAPEEAAPEAAEPADADAPLKEATAEAPASEPVEDPAPAEEAPAPADPEPVVEAEVEAAAEPQKPAKPKRRGWWSLGG